MYSKKVSFEKFEVEILMKQTCRSCFTTYIDTTRAEEAETLVVLQMVLRDQHTPCTQIWEYFKFIESDVSLVDVNVSKLRDIRKKAQSRKQHIALVIVFEPLYIVVFVTLLDLVFRVYVVFEYEREEKEKEESSGYLYTDGRSRRKHTVEIKPFLVHMSFHLEREVGHGLNLRFF